MFFSEGLVDERRYKLAFLLVATYIAAFVVIARNSSGSSREPEEKDDEFRLKVGCSLAERNS